MEGGLSKPSDEFMSQMEQLENIFYSENMDTILISKFYLENLLKKSASVNCSDAAKKLFFRSRMYFRLRHLNKTLQDRTVSNKRKMKKVVQ